MCESTRSQSKQKKLRRLNAEIEPLVFVELLQDIMAGEKSTEDEKRVNYDTSVQDHHVDEVRI
ncbi:hypothetical protein J6590_080599 [Homalodisca vitripennis]|nr:hypothetical protein J6590_080599 [Homalodisca vitripennis]